MPALGCGEREDGVAVLVDAEDVGLGCHEQVDLAYLIDHLSLVEARRMPRGDGEHRRSLHTHTDRDAVRRRHGAPRHVGNGRGARGM